MNFAVIIPTLLFLLAALPPQAPKVPPAKSEIQFKATAGTVTFKHEEHATKRATACQKCHHTMQPKSTELPKACSTCHLKADAGKVLSLRNAVHKNCWTCHKEEKAKGKKAPVQTECKGCHSALSSLAALPPQAPKIPPAKSEIQFKATAGTVAFKHGEHATKRATACQKCHHTMQAKSTELPKACSTCHLKADAGKVPSLRNAVHKNCWTCHKEEKAKGKKAPVQAECKGCHTAAKA